MSLTNIILITIFSGILIYNLWPETVAPKSNNRVRLPDLDLPTHNDPEFMRRFWRPYLNVKSQLLPISNDMDLAQSSKMLLYHTFADMSIMLWGHLLNPELNVAKSEEIPEENGEIIYSKTLAALICMGIPEDFNNHRKATIGHFLNLHSNDANGTHFMSTAFIMDKHKGGADEFVRHLKPFAPCLDDPLKREIFEGYYLIACIECKKIFMQAVNNIN